MHVRGRNYGNPEFASFNLEYRLISPHAGSSFSVSWATATGGQNSMSGTYPEHVPRVISQVHLHPVCRTIASSLGTTFYHLLPALTLRSLFTDSAVSPVEMRPVFTARVPFLH